MCRAEPDPLLFPTFGSDQLTLPRDAGKVETTSPGRVLFRDGDPSSPLIVVLQGSETPHGSACRNGGACGEQNWIICVRCLRTHAVSAAIAYSAGNLLARRFA